MRTTISVLVLILFSVTNVWAQSRLLGSNYIYSAGNFPDSFGVVVNPVTQELIDYGTAPFELTFDGIEEAAGGSLVNERVVAWPGVENGIFAVQASGIDGETEFQLVDWENSGEIVEFSIRTADGSYFANEPDEQSFYSMLGLEWSNSKDQDPLFFETGFYFYYAKDGVPTTGMETSLPTIGLLVGEHPFDETVPEVMYIAYSRGQVDEITEPFSGGFDLTGGTSQLDADTGSWDLLATVMGIDINGQNELHIGMLVEPPTADLTILPGDIDQNGTIDARDFDSLASAIIAGANGTALDLNSDSAVNELDRKFWVEEINNTYFGDSNLDGEFNSGDFVAVFQAGQYEDGIARNSTWATGDWNGDQEFDSGDFVLAFQSGGFEIGPRQATTSVPEPTSALLVFIGLAGVFAKRRRQ